MIQRSLPRYFVSRADDSSSDLSPGETLPPAHLLDSFFVGNRHIEEREWVVALDSVGRLQALPDDAWATFPGAVRNQLAYHEISRRGKGRLLQVTQVFLFHLQLLEQPVGAPGCNDPVYLYGTLYGPYPDAGTEPLAGVEGQLTITRGDLLAGLVYEAAHAFHYEKSNVKAAPDRRCFHLLVPGDTEEETRQGRGIVLAYPLLPAELITDDVANELVVSRLLHDLLSALKEDLAREGVDHPLRSEVLPVPNRSMLEQQLIAQGYTINGDSAIKKIEAGQGLQGKLASVLGALMNEQLALPPEGGVDEFLSLAGRALETLTGWPSPRAVALRNLVQPAPARRSSVTRHTPPINIPKASAPLPPPYKKPSADATAWMQDFIAAHRQPDSPPPRLTAILEKRQQSLPTSQSDSSVPQSDWMNDFAQDTASATKRDRDSNPPSEWMEDFK